MKGSNFDDKASLCVAIDYDGMNMKMVQIRILNVLNI